MNTRALRITDESILQFRTTQRGFQNFATLNSDTKLELTKWKFADQDLLGEFGVCKEQPLLQPLVLDFVVTACSLKFNFKLIYLEATHAIRPEVA